LTSAAHDDLQRIPGVGPAIAGDLRRLGVERVADLRGRDPEAMYEELQRLSGQHLDRCLLYVFREAVYYAATPHPERELIKWWHWKDGGLADRRSLIGERRSPRSSPR